jgi:predicted cobalt transporter CbtA
MGVTYSASLATEPAVMSARSFLVRGLLAGLIAGLVAFVVAYLVGEPAINAAIAIEEAGGLGDHHAAHHPAAIEGSAASVVPRVLQSTAGLLTGTIVAGVTLGGLLGVLSALALGRLGSLGVRGISLSLAAIGFVSVSLMPFVAYPPNPPAIGHPDTIGVRTALYFIMLAGSVIAAVTAVLVGRELAERWGAWYATLSAIGGYLLVTLTAMALLPSYSEVPGDYPATLLYEFRAASLLTQLALWATLGLVLGELLHRLQPRAGVEITGPVLADQAL